MPVNGLFHELYCPEDIDLLHTEYLMITNHCLDANNLFWAQLFNVNELKKLIDKYPLDCCPEYIVIKQNPDLFLTQVEKSIGRLCSKDNDELSFFRYMETLSIVCKLYSDYSLNHTKLTIQNGYELDISSAKKIYDSCLDDLRNPYFSFVMNEVMPCIYKYTPSILFIDGQISMYNMAICRLIKMKNPKTHICVTRHSSEYYSLNKLEKYLSNNMYLFRMVDSVILEFFDDIECKMISALENGIPMESIPNIMFKKNNEIIRTEIQVPTTDYTPEILLSSVSRKTINVHIDKYTKCYWNKCYFCGINKKYLFENNCEHDQFFHRYLEALSAHLNEIEYVWLIDEAITVSKLRTIAEFLLQNGIKVYWQARTRIEEELLDDDTINLLAKSGLKELRLGLESASISVLRAMNKFEEGFSIGLVEELCRKYTMKGISIHFPIIVGFPGETDDDRRKTFNFLQIMHQKYSVTFNINLFMLDISSFVFSHPNQFDVEITDDESVLNDKLSNSVKWLQKNDKAEMSLNQIREQYMRNVLYPWMPSHSILKPHIFYRLSETIRNTLIWKSSYNTYIDSEPSYDYEDEYVITDELSIGYDNKRTIYIIYNWETHHYMIGNENFMLLLKEFTSPQKLHDVTNTLFRINSSIYEQSEVIELIKKMIVQKFIIRKGKEA